MKVSDLMQRHVVTAREEQSLKALAETLFDHGISGMPVVGADGTVVGVVSEADLLHKQGGRPTPRKGALARFRPRGEGRQGGRPHRRRGDDGTRRHGRAGEHRGGGRAADARPGRQPSARGWSATASCSGSSRAQTSCVRSGARTTRSRRRSGMTSCSASSGSIRRRAPSGWSTARSSSPASWRREGQVELLTALVEKVPGVVSVTARVGHRDPTPGRRLAGSR